MEKTSILSIPKSRIAVELMAACLGGCFLALLSQVEIRLSVSPIPMTLQTFAVFLLGGVLGSRRAGASALAYLIQGSCFLPVFAGGKANPLWILTPQAGFLISFIFGGFIIGKMVERNRQGNILHILGALIIGQLIIFAIGMSWLSFYLGLKKAFLCGVIPFLPGAGLKIIAASLVIRGYWGIK